MAVTDSIVARVQADLQQALAKASKARSLLDECEREAADLQAFLRTFERYAAPAGAGGGLTQGSEHGSNKRAVAQVGSRARQLVDVSIATIRRKGAPVKIGDLLDAVLAEGLTLGGSDQKSNLAGYLSRDPRVASRGRSVGWDIVDNEAAVFRSVSADGAFFEDREGAADRLVQDPPCNVDDLLG